MKKLNLILCITAFSLITSGLFAQALPDWNSQNSSQGTLANIQRTAKVGIGTYYYPDDISAWYGANGPQLETWSQNNLNSSVGSSCFLESVSGPVGQANFSQWIRNSKWLHRTASPSAPGGWDGISIHDGISINNTYKTPGTDTKTWWERDPSNDIQSWGTDQSVYMTLRAGNLGINNPVPSARIDIYDNSNNPELVARANHSIDNTYCIHASVYRDRTKAFSVGHNNYANTTNNWKETFIVYGDGRTVIGTQTVSSRPNSLLSVSGEIDCQSLFVLKPITWSDKVFETGYKLEDLSDVEKFIAKHKHLPGVKNEKEILENGYDVNEVDAVLLEKIENLYLYLIKQQKEIDGLKKSLQK